MTKIRLEARSEAVHAETAENHSGVTKSATLIGLDWPHAYCGHPAWWAAVVGRNGGPQYCPALVPHIILPSCLSDVESLLPSLPNLHTQPSLRRSSKISSHFHTDALRRKALMPRRRWRPFRRKGTISFTILDNLSFL